VASPLLTAYRQAGPANDRPTPPSYLSTVTFLELIREVKSPGPVPVYLATAFRTVVHAQRGIAAHLVFFLRCQNIFSSTIPSTLPAARKARRLCDCLWRARVLSTTNWHESMLTWSTWEHAPNKPGQYVATNSTAVIRKGRTEWRAGVSPFWVPFHGQSAPWTQGLCGSHQYAKNAADLWPYADTSQRLTRLHNPFQSRLAWPLSPFRLFCVILRPFPQ